MSAPVKPWETSTLRNVQYTQNFAAMPPNILHRLAGRVATGNNQQVPPLPPRPNTRSAHHYGFNGPLYNGGYGMYGGYGMPYGGGFGYRGEYDSRFLQVAEEATNGTFQSIESFVRAFSSVTMMLESTYQALHMSFRSVLSVADNMSKLRTVALNVFSSLSILKFIYWMYRKILFMLGLVNSVPAREHAWRAAESQVLGNVFNPAVPAQPSSWPLVGMFTLMLASPYLIYRVLATHINAKTPEGWDPSTGIRVKAICNFDNPASGEVPFKKDDILVVPADFRVHHGWTIAKRENNIGYIPADRVALIFGPENTSTLNAKVKEINETVNENQGV